MPPINLNARFRAHLCAHRAAIAKIGVDQYRWMVPRCIALFRHFQGVLWADLNAKLAAFTPVSMNLTKIHHNLP